MAEIFSLHVLHFSLRARSAISFPAGKAANVLRGAFGTVLRRAIVQDCAYFRVFQPGDLDEGPSGMVSGPRPYAIRARQLDGKTVAPGEDFGFDFHLFDTGRGAEAVIDEMVQAVGEMMRDGIGPRQGTAEIIRVNRDVVQVDLALLKTAPSRIVVTFLTPTELKGHGGIVDRPEFGVLFGRIRDRVSTLRRLYGDGPIQADFRGMGERAKVVELEACSLKQVEVMRRSSRTGQSHPIGGFVGEAQYRGSFEEFLPWLRAAEWTGVGRQTVWGKGEIQVRPLE